MNNLKLYGLLVGLIIIIMALCDALTFKAVSIGGYNFAASGLIYSFSFFLLSIATEVYGYKLAGRIIWVQMICNIIFVLTMNLFVLLPSPEGSTMHSLYFGLYHNVWRVLIGSCISIPISYFLNSLIISKLKIYMYGKIFMLRFMVSNILGSAVLVSISYPINFYNQFTSSQIATIAFDTWVYKLIMATIFLPICIYLTKIIKKIEKMDCFDYDISYNPAGVFASGASGKNQYAR